MIEHEERTLDSSRGGQTYGTAPVLLRTEHVGKVYLNGQVRALQDVSLAIRQGEYVAIMGPSGSGKSTLLNLVGILDRPTTGELYLEGRPYSQIRRANRVRSRKFGFVFQAFHLLTALSAAENVQVPMFADSLPARERPGKARELLRFVGMEHRAAHLPECLSVGERQRVAIARALANDPAVLLADEPTGNLDSGNARGIFELLDRLRRERQMTILLITHDAELAGRAERVVLMRDGRIQSDGPTAAILAVSGEKTAPRRQ
ncbi:MAG: ABC transporter ATP-binding protein [Thermoguttaceae bacterium]